MSYKKIYVAIDCQTPEEAKQLQKVAEEMSALFAMSARDILDVYPYVRKNAGLIKTTIKTLSKDGLKGLGKVVSYLMTNFKK